MSNPTEVSDAILQTFLSIHDREPVNIVDGLFALVGAIDRFASETRKTPLGSLDGKAEQAISDFARLVEYAAKAIYERLELYPEGFSFSGALALLEPLGFPERVFSLAFHLLSSAGIVKHEYHGSNCVGIYKRVSKEK